MSIQSLRRRPRLCVFSYGPLNRLVNAVLPEFAGRADIHVQGVVFDDALHMGREIEKSRAHDVVISAGANAALLRSALSMPVVSIKVSGYDLLVALKKARQFSDRVGVGIYHEKIPELEDVKELLQVEVSQQPYETIDDIQSSFSRLREQGYEVIVGSSLVVELAEQNGMHGILVYSLDSVRQAIEGAVQIAEQSVLQAARYDQLNAVLQHLHEAVLAVDVQQRITAANPLMDRVLGSPAEGLLGRDLRIVAPSLSLGDVLAERDEAVDTVVQLAGRTYLMTRVPLRDAGRISGALLTLYDAQSIQRADKVVRSQRRSRGLLARYHFDQIQGISPAIRQARSVGQRCARTLSTVLITGESGTGKELFAQAIHNASARGDGPFVALNCASFPESLLESELFGYEDGAFTGARKGGKPGLFESAHTGTLFLDEIGDMPITLQTRLLRVLQEREVVRLGGQTPLPVDVRIIAATHCELPERIREGKFRADLYYRLNILRVALPPLRERAQDIPGLALQLLFTALRRQGCSLPADQALAPLMPALLQYPWPGNVRELENIMERLAAFLGSFSTVAHIDYQQFLMEAPELASPAFAAAPAPAPAAAAAASATPQPLQAAPRLDTSAIVGALTRAGGNRQLAAAMLGVSRTTLWRRLREEQLD
ncbi:MAG: propionate catabolism operon regulatory protein PrpR [Rubrivivax sp.]|nr:propionate catabolism operon regulatory protein PrpR [Rubrivivax sp.]